MTWTADELIQKRREKWDELHDIEFDMEFRLAVADELLENAGLRDEVRAFPEKLIELVFVVVNKQQKTEPFFMNEVQQDFVGRLNKAIRDFEEGLITEISMLVLKGRQQGFTTFITAYQLSACITNRNFQGFTLADNSSNSESIFQNKAKFPYAQLPDKLKPTEKFNNKRQLLFEKLNSVWSVDTATKNVGRSKTVNFFHGSECAFWLNGIATIQAALGEALTKDCIKIYESTANGFNDYQKMWSSGVHINCFYGWWRTPEYRLNFPSEEDKENFNSDIDKGADWIWQRLKWLRDDKGLELEQLFWYFKKFEGYIDKDTIKQEYPCSPEEAFLLSGQTVFDTERLMERLETAPKPVKTGYFAYDYDGLKVGRIRWVPDRNGPIKIYRKPNTPAVTKYCLGGDTAGEGSDFYTGHVLDARTGEQVAHLKQQFDPDQYVMQMYCLGAYYKWALIGIEANFDTYPIRELQRLKYPKQYVREQVDSITHKREKRLGFRTDTLSRPTIISNLIRIVRESVESINDKETLEELMTIVKNEKGKIEAPEGLHDDDMMGLAIAHHIRDQVVFDDNAINGTSQFHFDSERTREAGSDYGEEIVII